MYLSLLSLKLNDLESGALKTFQLWMFSLLRAPTHGNTPGNARGSLRSRQRVPVQTSRPRPGACTLICDQGKNRGLEIIRIGVHVMYHAYPGHEQCRSASRRRKGARTLTSKRPESKHARAVSSLCNASSPLKPIVPEELILCFYSWALKF